MGKFYNEIPDDPKLLDWIKSQQLFHVATAPLNGGHVNVSPKGQPTLKVVNSKAVWYLDLTGSGNETISHLYEPGNARMTLMFEAFQGPPQIVRLFGHGRVIERGTPEFDELLDNRGPDGYGWPTPELQPGARAIIWLDIEKVGTSCGYSVPFYEFKGHRDVLKNWSVTLEKNDREVEDPWSLHPKKSLKNYWLHFNTWSMDGLPGYKGVSDRANTALVRKVMSDVGLNYDNSLAGRRGTPERWHLLLVGLIFGWVLAEAVKGNMTSIARQLMKA
ncbi:hypothetical protein PsYK624_084250 [Phanerochaete sordida]|uniref:Pyridoxamine 5'-phosphate oxidase N-terminal domain-containing protein n=1 Tax=Phanerochaete sordida TaxID=48140 RepID=A0A9P3GCB6_9APHY|nr:hypothetical protein PsYK624_084250 [Phanerochaete sordida]